MRAFYFSLIIPGRCYLIILGGVSHQFLYVHVYTYVYRIKKIERWSKYVKQEIKWFAILIIAFYKWTQDRV